MMNFNVIARFNKTNVNTFQVLRHELMKVLKGGEKLSYLGTSFMNNRNLLT